MPTPFDYIRDDRRIQDHWVRRLVALIIDLIIVFIIAWFISLFIALSGVFWFLGWSFFASILFFLYSTILEGLRGATLGKELIKLRVVSQRGRIDFGKAAVRNISKIFWLFLLLDILIGLFTDGHPKQRWLDRVAETWVEEV